MTHPKPPQSARGDAPLSDADAQLVSRVRESYRAPELTAEARVAFQEALDARLERGNSWLGGVRRPSGFGSAFAGLAVVAVLGVVTWGVFSAPGVGTTPEPGPQIARLPAAAAPVVATLRFDTTPEETLLGFTDDDTAGMDADLPDDYEAIASLFLLEEA